MTARAAERSGCAHRAIATTGRARTPTSPTTRRLGGRRSRPCEGLQVRSHPIERPPDRRRGTRLAGSRMAYSQLTGEGPMSEGADEALQCYGVALDSPLQMPASLEPVNEFPLHLQRGLEHRERLELRLV